MKKLSEWISEVKARCEKATEGPWGRYGYKINGEIKPSQGSLEAAPGLSIGSVTHTEPLARFNGYLLPVEDNVDFVVNSRLDLPKAIEIIEVMLKVVQDINVNSEIRWDYSDIDKACVAAQESAEQILNREGK